MEDKSLGEEERLHRLAIVLNSYVKALEKPRRREIIKRLYVGGEPLTKTSEELMAETDISQGSLYNHLNALCDSGLIVRSGWPYGYCVSHKVQKMLDDLDGVYSKYCLEMRIFPKIPY